MKTETRWAFLGNRFLSGLIIVAVLLVTPVVRATEPPVTAEKLQQAIIDLWVTGGGEQTLRILVAGAEASDAQISTTALFHLGCAYLQKGDRAAALECLKKLEAAAETPAAKAQAERLLGILQNRAPTPPSLSLDLTEVEVTEAIRLAAQTAGRHVIIDSGVPKKRVTIHLPRVDFDQFLKIIGDIVPLSVQSYGDILMIQAKTEPPVDAQTADGKVTFDFSQTDVRLVLRLVARKAGVNLVFHHRVRGQITIRLVDVEPQEALHLIARSHDLHIQPDGNALMVFPKDMQAEIMPGGAQEQVLSLAHLSPADAVALLQKESIAATVGESSKSIVVQGPVGVVARARDILDRHDKSKQPILIAMNVWEALPDQTIDPAGFVQKTAAEKAKLAKLVSSPRVLTLPGYRAKVEIGSNAETGAEGSEPLSRLKFEFRPTDGVDGMIKLDLEGSLVSRQLDQGKIRENLRNIVSSFVVKPGHPFAYEVQGGQNSLILEFHLSRPE
jgi:hypothetical protein